MFDHLEQRLSRKVSWHHHLSLGVLMVSCLSLALAFCAPILSFTKDEHPATIAVAKLWVDVSDSKQRQIVGPQENIDVAHFVLQTDGPLTLQRLRLSLDGLYQPIDLSTLRLYVDDVQIGRDRSLDNAGTVTFETPTATLSAGSHDLIVRTNWLVNRPGQLLTARIASDKDIVFSQPAITPSLQAVFPLSTAGIVFVDQGAWVMVQPPVGQAVSAVADHALQQAAVTIPIATRAEPITLQKIAFTVETSKFLPQSISLLDDQTTLKTWTVSQKKDLYVWEPNAADILITSGQPKQYQLIVRGTAENDLAAIKVTTQEVSGKGFVSAKSIAWQSDLGLSQTMYLVHDEPSWTVDATSTATNGYRLKLSTLSSKSIDLNSLVLQVDTNESIANQTWKVYVRDQEVPTVITRSNPNLVRVRFKPYVTMTTGDSFELRATAGREGRVQASVRLLPTEFNWVTRNDGWFAVTSSELPTPPASVIRF